MTVDGRRLTVLFLCFLVACNSQPAATAVVNTQTPTTTVTITQTPTQSFTQAPTQTQQPAFTPSKTQPPSATPTFDVHTIVTRTPAPRAQCPAAQAGKVPDFEYPSFTSEEVEQFYDHVLDFLNVGGSSQAIIKIYQQNMWGRIDREAQIIDLTGDTIPELVLTAPNSSVVYLCKEGQYSSTHLISETYHYATPKIFQIKDINRNGVPEIIFGAGDSRFQFYTVYEWDGSDFQILNIDFSASRSDASRCDMMMGDSKIETADTGTSLELIFKQGIPIWTEYSEGLPWRKETRTCTWNGTAFVFTKTQLAPPEYRFQAVQDGDRATLAGEYDKALSFYQQAIFDDKLDWFSQDRRLAELNAAPGVYPTPDQSMRDGAEYPNLAAYARFRIMLLHIKRGFLPEAKTVYDALQEKFPSGQPGHAYAEMATAFWQTYTSSKSMEQACNSAIDYATTHSTEILAYLGNGDSSQGFYGEQSLTYTPASVCPFGNDDGQ